MTSGESSVLSCRSNPRESLLYKSDLLQLQQIRSEPQGRSSVFGDNDNNLLWFPQFLQAYVTSGPASLSPSTAIVKIWRSTQLRSPPRDSAVVAMNSAAILTLTTKTSNFFLALTLLIGMGWLFAKKMGSKMTSKDHTHTIDNHMNVKFYVGYSWCLCLQMMNLLTSLICFRLFIFKDNDYTLQ